MHPCPGDSPVIREPGEIIRAKTLTKRWWSTPAVGFNAILEVPVFKFEVVAPIETVAALSMKPAPGALYRMRLPNSIFGVPIRKDLLHRVYWWHRKALAGYDERMQLYKWDWPGSNRKARPFLNAGLPKMGRRKAPGKWDGSSARPVRPKDFRENLPKRIIWLALKSMLSAKFAQNEILVVDSFCLGSHKTKHALALLRGILGSKCSSALLVHEGISDVNDAFRWATAHIPKIRRENVDGVNLSVLLKYRKVIFTENALKSIIAKIEEYPKKNRWLAKNATPSGKPAIVPSPVPGWDAEWKAKRQRMQKCHFRAREFWLENKKWKWSTQLTGALKIPRDDPLKGFRITHRAGLNGQSNDKPWERFELNELYYNDEDLEPLA